MKNITKAVLTTAVTASICAFNISAAAADEIQPGRYAPTSSENAKMFHNRGSFTCYGNGAAYCQSFEGRKFTPEEKELIEGGPVLADLQIIKDENTGEYSVAGRVFIIRNCELATGKIVERDGKYEYNDTFVKCQKNDNGSISCPFIDPMDEEIKAPHAIFTFSQNSPKKIAVAAKVVPEAAELFNSGCFEMIDESIYDYETDEEYEHTMYLSAKLDFLEADGDLNMKWKALTKAQKDKLLPAQRKWIKEKDEKCGAVTMKGSKKELTVMYKCQADMTREKATELFVDE
jgi:uncharacterized protein YecT (DUF1311 family)